MMCGLGFDENRLQKSRRVRAQKEHHCYACDESILAGEFCIYSAVVDSDGAFDAYRHCLRCWTMFVELLDKGSDSVRWDLNCGEVWEDPPERVAALAFMTREEAQSLSPKVW